MYSPAFSGAGVRFAFVDSYTCMWSIRVTRKPLTEAACWRKHTCFQFKGLNSRFDKSLVFQSFILCKLPHLAHHTHHQTSCLRPTFVCSPQSSQKPTIRTTGIHLHWAMATNLYEGWTGWSFTNVDLIWRRLPRLPWASWWPFWCWPLPCLTFRWPCPSGALWGAPWQTSWACDAMTRLLNKTAQQQNNNQTGFNSPYGGFLSLINGWWCDIREWWWSGLMLTGDVLVDAGWLITV